MAASPDTIKETSHSGDPLYRWTIGAIWFLLISTPLVYIWFWVDPSTCPRLDIGSACTYEPATVGAWQRLAGFIITGAPLAATLVAVWHIKRLVTAFESRTFFTEETVRLPRMAARMLFLAIVLAIISRPMLSVALTIHKGPGQRLLEITVGDSGEWVGLLVALVLLFFSRALDAARRQSEELAEII